MDGDTATNLGAVATISGLLVLVVKFLIDSEARKINEVSAKQTEVLDALHELQTAVKHLEAVLTESEDHA